MAQTLGSLQVARKFNLFHMVEISPEDYKQAVAIFDLINAFTNNAKQMECAKSSNYIEYTSFAKFLWIKTIHSRLRIEKLKDFGGQLAISYYDDLFIKITYISGNENISMLSNYGLLESMPAVAEANGEADRSQLRETLLDDGDYIQALVIMVDKVNSWKKAFQMIREIKQI